MSHFALSFRKILLILFFFVLYLASSVPVGLFLYSLKSDLGVNVFSKTGYHAYVHCVKEQISKIGSEEDEPEQKPAKTDQNEPAP